ncbi:LG1 [Scenedesmus sp. PABB004]|nr:LG1 [Scenedesmus sp. PABB004]
MTRKGGARQGEGSTRCCVVGCEVDLASLGKPYNLKKHICPAHVRAPAVHCGGSAHRLWRFCQQCGRLEPLTSFEGNKRSCRTSLERRRGSGDDAFRLERGGGSQATSRRQRPRPLVIFDSAMTDAQAARPRDEPAAPAPSLARAPAADSAATAVAAALAAAWCEPRAAAPAAGNGSQEGSVLSAAAGAAAPTVGGAPPRRASPAAGPAGRALSPVEQADELELLLREELEGALEDERNSPSACSSSTCGASSDAADLAGMIERELRMAGSLDKCLSASAVELLRHQQAVAAATADAAGLLRSLSAVPPLGGVAPRPQQPAEVAAGGVEVDPAVAAVLAAALPSSALVAAARGACNGVRTKMQALREQFSELHEMLAEIHQLREAAAGIGVPHAAPPPLPRSFTLQPRPAGHPGVAAAALAAPLARGASLPARAGAAAALAAAWAGRAGV